jgi:hypothetical protein
MGHLINPISLRLKKHGIWQVSWNAFLKKDYIYFFFINRLLEQILNSFITLKCLKKKFIFFEFKYFVKNNKLIIFLGFKFIKKSKLKLKKLNLFKKKLTYILKKRILKLKSFYKYFNFNFNTNYNHLIKDFFFYQLFRNYNFKQLKKIYLLKIKQMKALSFISLNMFKEIKDKAFICLIFNKYIFFNCLKLYTNSLLFKLMTNPFIPLTKNVLKVYTFKTFLVNGINGFVINLNNNEFVYNFKQIYMKFLLKLKFYKQKALYFYKSFFIYYHERFKYKINKYKFKLNKFKNNIYFNCKLWKKKFNNLLLNLCILLI